MSDTRVAHIEFEVDVYSIPLSRDIYWHADENGVVSLAHVCLRGGKRSPSWIWQTCSNHQVVSLDPLHLEASIGWMNCCGRHGFIRNGQWEPAGDGGWQPVTDKEA